MSAGDSEDERIFNRRGRKHFRRTYSKTEVKIGAAIFVVLVLITAWVIWRGRHPDEQLLLTAADLYEPQSAPAKTLEKAGDPKDRGALPTDLAISGFKEERIASFGPDNLYEKINGREGYYKGFGFVRLDFASIASSDKPEIYFDLELFDLGRAENAIGAMSGEVPEGGRSAMKDDTLVFEGKSSILLARGKHYARLIGSEESDTVKAALAHARDRLIATLAKEELPLGFVLFAATLQIPADRISFEAENAFSLGFAKDVHLGRLPDETELFLAVEKDGKAAEAMAKKYTAGFKEYGEDGGTAGGISWVRDRYLSTFAGASSAGHCVIGVRGAPDKEKAVNELARLKTAAASLSSCGGGP